MSINQLTAVQMMLVTALVTVEHDREKHVPGVKSGPEAETFLVPEHVAKSLIMAGAVKEAEVVDADALLSQVDTKVIGTQTASSMVSTFADVADLVEADKLRGQLAEANAAHTSLLDQLAEKQGQLDLTQEQLVLANASLAEAHAQVAEGAAAVGQLKTTQGALDAANAQIAQLQAQAGDASANSGNSSAAAGDADAQASTAAAVTTRRKTS